MPPKQPVKLSEAKILIYLSEVANPFKYKTMISVKLDIDYIYLNRIMSQMEAKHWIKKMKSDIKNRVFYELTMGAPLRLAKQIMENS